MDNKLVTPLTVIEDIPSSIKCSKYNISDIKKFPKNLSVEDILIRSSNIGTLLLAEKLAKKILKFIEDSGLLKNPEIQLAEVGKPIYFDWNKCKLETVSYGYGITTTPIQALAVYSSSKWGKIIKPSLVRKNNENTYGRLISKRLVAVLLNLKKVVTEEGTAHFADKNGYYVGGKTGTSQNYKNENENLNTFISIFPSNKPKYGLLVMLEDPQVAKDLIYNYKGIKIKGFRNEAGGILFM